MTPQKWVPQPPPPLGRHPPGVGGSRTPPGHGCQASSIFFPNATAGRRIQVRGDMNKYEFVVGINFDEISSSVSPAFSRIHSSIVNSSRQIKGKAKFLHLTSRSFLCATTFLLFFFLRNCKTEQECRAPVPIGASNRMDMIDPAMLRPGAVIACLLPCLLSLKELHDGKQRRRALRWVAASPM